MTDAAKIALPAAAIENLTHHQQQADMDGTFVKVSRQALDEVLSFIAAMQPAPQEPVGSAAEITRLTEALRAAEGREKGLRADLRRCFRGETHAVRNERVNRKILEYTEAALKGPSHDA